MAFGCMVRRPVMTLNSRRRDLNRQRTRDMTLIAVNAGPADGDERHLLRDR